MKFHLNQVFIYKTILINPFKKSKKFKKKKVVKVFDNILNKNLKD